MIDRKMWSVANVPRKVCHDWMSDPDELGLWATLGSVCRGGCLLPRRARRGMPWSPVARVVHGNVNEE